MENLYIVWDEGYNFGIPIIDEQHRAIVSTINTYRYLVVNGKSEMALKSTFVMLNQYTTIHFMTEEDILEQTEYLEIINHKKLHNDLIKRMREIAIEVIQEKDYDFVLSFLKDWWLTHIRIEDAKYALHVKGKLKTT